MASPALERAASQTRTEDETRELCRAALKAKAIWEGYLFANTNGKTEDELVDLNIGTAKAMNDYIKADAAFRASIK